MEIEHIIPEAIGGPTVEENLWLACPLCNGRPRNKLRLLPVITKPKFPSFAPVLRLTQAFFCCRRVLQPARRSNDTYPTRD
jgi:5-methylcytosine-specific restriction endonuclease McrA